MYISERVIINYELAGMVTLKKILKNGALKNLNKIFEILWNNNNYYKLITLTRIIHH